MRLSDFRNFRIVTVDGTKTEVADVTCRSFFGKVTERAIFKKHVYWQFVDDGEFTPLRQAERLEDSFKVREAIKNGSCNRT